MGTLVTIMGTTTAVDSVARLLFGSVRRDVLALLLGRPEDRFYVREIVRAVGGGSGAVQRELKQLGDAGLLERTVSGRQVYFAANRAAPIFAELKAIIEKTTGTAEVLRESLAPLTSAGRIDVAFVYGSVAGGTQASDSDVDLLVIGDATLGDLVPLLRAAEKRLGRDVNPSVYPLPEFRAKMQHGAPFLGRVLAGKRIFVTGGEHDLERLAR